MELATTTCSWLSKPLAFSPPFQYPSKKILTQTSPLSNAQILKKENLCWYCCFYFIRFLGEKQAEEENREKLLSAGLIKGAVRGGFFFPWALDVSRKAVGLFTHIFWFFCLLLFLPPGVVTEACRERRCKSRSGHWSRCRSTGSGRAAGEVSDGTLFCVFLQKRKVVRVTECAQMVARHWPSIHSFP